MVRQWQEAFYDKNYAALAHPLARLRRSSPPPTASPAPTSSKRADVTPTVTHARTSGKTFLINFQVEKEDGVYPMIAPGAALHEMIRRPTNNPLLELPEDA